MNLGLSGKVALVTGSSAGLGRAAASALIEEGARVVVNSRNEESLEEAVGSIGADAGITADITDRAAAVNLVKDVATDFGRLDILVTNCGGPPGGGVDQSFDTEVWEDSFRRSVLAHVWLAEAAVPGMRHNSWGRIVSIQSLSVRQPIDRLLLSNATRPAAHGYFSSLARAVAGHGITCNLVLPYLIETPRVQKLVSDRATERGIDTERAVMELTNDIPIGRLGSPMEVAYLVAFLCSDLAAYITAQAIGVDGGTARGLH